MNQKSLNFLKMNSRWLQCGIILLLLGYITMGWNESPLEQMTDGIFAWNKLLLAPILLFAGYIFIGISLMIEPEK